MAVLAEVGQQQVADDGAGIEPHGAVHDELGVDDLGRVRGHHDRAGMEIAVNHGLRVAQEAFFQLGDGDLEGDVVTDGLGVGVELGRGPAVQFSDPIGIGEDQVLRDLPQHEVAAEFGDAALLLARRQRQVGGAEERLARKRAMSAAKRG